MNVDRFFQHHGIRENPFAAEEARLDPIFARLSSQQGHAHPDYLKILGQVDHPSTSVVFGEKGSGKTAIRLMIGQAVREHNAANPDRRALLVAHDDLNGMLDLVLQSRARRQRKADIDQLLREVRLEDHQDAILSRAVTRIVDALICFKREDDTDIALPTDMPRRMKTVPRRTRLNMAVLAALYDQPSTGDSLSRWPRLRRALRLGARPAISWPWVGAMTASLGAIGLVACWAWRGAAPDWLIIALTVAIAAAAVCWGLWVRQFFRLWRLTRQIERETIACARTARDLRLMLSSIAGRDLQGQPWPMPGPGRSNSRYDLTQRLMDMLEALGYRGILVVVDRVDEPTVVSGHAERMRSIVWPLLDNKFLKQDRVGLKLLLPIELRHKLHRESPEFYEEARLDKQHLIDPLVWSGAILYDLATDRLRICRPDAAEPMTLNDLFTEEVSKDTLIDALDQMHQPRDAFKFLYAVIQEHCRMLPDDAAQFRIARPTLEAVRRSQSQRVQDLQRGLSPS